MKPIPTIPETEAVARRVIWFEEPVQVLSDPIRFMAYAMTYATHEDMKIIGRYVSDDEFIEALDKGPARYHRSAFLGLLEFQVWPLSASTTAVAPIPRTRDTNIGLARVARVGRHSVSVLRRMKASA